MDLTRININVDIGGDIVTYSKDGIILPELTGKASKVHVISKLINYYTRTEWFKSHYNITAPVIVFNLTETDEEGNVIVLTTIPEAKIRALAGKTIDSDEEYNLKDFIITKDND